MRIRQISFLRLRDVRRRVYDFPLLLPKIRTIQL
ncbi:unnamed protein product [Rhodiola kirilowii]